jgi:hypothetical protein
MNVVGQLYQFTRMGFEGYREVNEHMLATMHYLADGLRHLKVGVPAAGEFGVQRAQGRGAASLSGSPAAASGSRPTCTARPPLSKTDPPHPPTPQNSGV